MVEEAFLVAGLAVMKMGKKLCVHEFGNNIKTYFSDGIRKPPVDRYKKCVELQGNYVEL
jgi:hypothetical protein